MASPTFSTASMGEVTTDRTMLMGSLTTPFAVPSFIPFLIDFLTAWTGAHTKPPATEIGTQTGDVTTVTTRLISFISLSGILLDYSLIFQMAGEFMILKGFDDH